MVGEEMVFGRCGEWWEKEWIVGEIKNGGKRNGLWEM